MDNAMDKKEIGAKELEFLSKEVEQIRKTYDSFIAETRQLERYVVLITGLTWSWCAANLDKKGVTLLLWFPAFITGLFAMRAAGIHYQSIIARRYIAKIEKLIGINISYGWANEQIGHKKSIFMLPALTAYIFWSVIGIGTIVIPFLFINYYKN